MSGTLREHFPAGATPRPEQARVLDALEDALAEADADPGAPRLLVVEAPPGVGKSHLAVTLARWSGDAYLLTSQKLLQDQYEREFGDLVQLVKGRDNYACERYPDARVPTSLGMCRRPRGPLCQCPYARAKAAALAGPVFCANTWYFATLRHWHAEQLRRRRLLVVDEAHNLEGQLVNVYAVRFTGSEMKEWFGAPLPRFETADEYRPVLAPHLERLDAELEAIARALETVRPPDLEPDAFLQMPPSREEVVLLERRDALEGALARLRAFVEGETAEWVVRYPPELNATLELTPLAVAAEARALLSECAEITVLLSAYLGPATVVAETLGVPPEQVRAFATPSPFPLEQRPIVYRPVGALSRTNLAALEPALFAEIVAILGAHPRDKGLIHVASYALARRLMADVAQRAPAEARRLIFVESSDAKAAALDRHRASPAPTVLVSPSLREGVDLPDDFLRFQIVTKVPYPDLGDPWTAARRARDPRWYAVETAKALVQAYGRSCRHAEDHGVTYVLDAQFERFLQHNRALLPEWFLDAAHRALKVSPFE
ncbi:MAG TPA: helicase C-terminal domain-containing protein [Methylomirabilota bacterium]|nr:helicase C-terminal domain-containing protein [Methylomirabilota bacterium]